MRPKHIQDEIDKLSDQRWANWNAFIDGLKGTNSYTPEIMEYKRTYEAVEKQILALVKEYPRGNHELSHK